MRKAKTSTSLLIIMVSQNVLLLAIRFWDAIEAAQTPSRNTPSLAVDRNCGRTPSSWKGRGERVRQTPQCARGELLDRRFKCWPRARLADCFWTASQSTGAVLAH